MGKAGAEKALKTMQHSRLADHCLELKRSERAGSKGGKTEESKASLEKPSTKLLVRNIPFQATKEEVTAIFKTFGELSAVRLPRDGRHWRSQGVCIHRVRCTKRRQSSFQEPGSQHPLVRPQTGGRVCVWRFVA